MKVQLVIVTTTLQCTKTICLIRQHYYYYYNCAWNELFIKLMQCIYISVTEAKLFDFQCQFCDGVQKKGGKSLLCQ